MSAPEEKVPTAAELRPGESIPEDASNIPPPEPAGLPDAAVADPSAPAVTDEQLARIRTASSEALAELLSDDWRSRHPELAALIDEELKERAAKEAADDQADAAKKIEESAAAEAAAAEEAAKKKGGKKKAEAAPKKSEPEVKASEPTTGFARYEVLKSGFIWRDGSMCDVPAGSLVDEKTAALYRSHGISVSADLVLVELRRNQLGVLEYVKV